MVLEVTSPSRGGASQADWGVFVATPQNYNAIWLSRPFQNLAGDPSPQPYMNWGEGFREKGK